MKMKLAALVLGFALMSGGISYSAPDKQASVNSAATSIGSTIDTNEIRTTSTIENGIEHYHIDLPSPSVDNEPTILIVVVFRDNINQELKSAMNEAKEMGAGNPGLTRPAYFLEPDDTAVISPTNPTNTGFALGRF